MASTLPPLDASADQEARTQRHLVFLDTLIAQGMDLAARLHQQSTTPSGLCSAVASPGIAVPFITPEVIATFAQINQTVRRAILVSRKLAEPLALARPTPIKSQPEDPGPRGPEPAQAETARTEFADRLHSPDLEDRIGNRPVQEMITEISRDLAVISTDEQARLERRTPPDLQTQAARPTSPAHNPHNERPGDAAEAGIMVLHSRGEPEFRPPKR